MEKKANKYINAELRDGLGHPLKSFLFKEKLFRDRNSVIMA